MSLRLCVLGSGSSGNCSLVQVNQTCFLLDAGFGPRSLAKRLVGTGVDLPDIRAILLTHLDRDHFSPNLARTLLRYRITLACHRRHEALLYRRMTDIGEVDARLLRREGLIHLFDDYSFTLPVDTDEKITVKPIKLAHDKTGCFGYVVTNQTKRLGYATDLGRVPDPLVKALSVGVDLLAIESNYDPAMQDASTRPWFLKQRITGGSGHLSNQQALDAIRDICDQAPHLPRHIVLLHLSRQCNDPKLLKSLYGQDPTLAPRYCLTHHLDATPWLDADDPLPTHKGAQLRMFFNP